MTTPAFAEVGPRVHVLRHPVLDVNVTLVLGELCSLSLGQDSRLQHIPSGIRQRCADLHGGLE